MNARPLFGNIIIRQLDPTKTTKSGLILPDTLRKNSNTLVGEIIAVGSGSLAWDGTPIPIEPGIEPKAHVVYKKHEAELVEIEDETYWVVDQRHILVVL